jgi:heme exporter protein B
MLIKRQVCREWLAQVRDWRSVFNACFFFVLVCVFFPLTMPADAHLLRRIAPGIIWIAALLALFLSAERLFHPDEEEGLIEQWMVSGYPVSLLVFAKLWVHWLFHVLPMLIMCPFLVLLFRFTFSEICAVALSLLCGTPTILALCALAAAFGIGLKQKSVVMGLVVFPLTVPVMILGSTAIGLAMDGMAYSASLAMLLAIACLAMGFLPFALAAVLKTH